MLKNHRFVLSNFSSFEQGPKCILLSILFLSVLFMISSVSAADFTTNSNSDDIQSFIGNDLNQNTEIVFKSGNYTSISNINITKTATIRGEGQVNIIGSGGILFNITAANVKIINLNITGFNTAITSNSGGLFVNKTNISTITSSIVCNGNSLTNMVIENNIIHSSDGEGVLFNISASSNVNVSFSNNKITGLYGVLLNANSNSNNNITATFFNNSIHGIGSFDYGVSIRVGYSYNNTILLTFTKNNITSSSRSVELYAYNNNINTNNKVTANFTNNNISLNGTVLTRGEGVYLEVDGGNNTIIFTNNTISGVSEGIAIPAAASSNNITFTNNNITGGNHGAYLAAQGNDNIITFSNNNFYSISGAEKAAFYLAASGSNNNITFTKNNFTGTSESGFYIFVDNFSDSNFTFTENNIWANSYAVYVYYKQDVSGLSFLNNVLNSNNTGMYFVSQFAELCDTIISGNTINCTNVGIRLQERFTGDNSYVQINCNYNYILANVGLNFADTKVLDNGCNFDYNWWGSNAGPQGSYSNVHINNYFVMSISTTVANLSRIIGENLAINYAFVLNGTNINAEALSKFSYFTVNIMLNGKLWASVDGRKSAQYNVPLTVIDNTITTQLNNQVSTIKYKGGEKKDPPKPDYKPTLPVVTKVTSSLVIDNFKPLYNKENIIKATLRDKNGKLLANKQVVLFINNKQVATAKTNSVGVVTFKYTFKTRNVHNVVVKFAEDGSHYASNSNTLSLNPKDKTTIILAKFSAKYKKTTTIKATLKDHNNKAIAKKYIKFYANNKYLGQAKTNAKGVATLTKKISVKGNVNFVAKYAGDKAYYDSSYTRKINVK